MYNIEKLYCLIRFETNKLTLIFDGTNRRKFYVNFYSVFVGFLIAPNGFSNGENRTC